MYKLFYSTLFYSIKIHIQMRIKSKIKTSLHFITRNLIVMILLRSSHIVSHKKWLIPSSLRCNYLCIICEHYSHEFFSLSLYLSSIHPNNCWLHSLTQLRPWHLELYTLTWLTCHISELKFYFKLNPQLFHFSIYNFCLTLHLQTHFWPLQLEI